jgi:hypothetical protein
MTGKLITTRFPANCRKCGNKIPEGSQAYWRKGYGSVHPACNETRPEERPSAAIPKVPAAEENAIDFLDIKDKFLSVLDGIPGYDSGVNVNNWKRYHSMWSESKNSDWSGATGEDMRAWISRGFHVEGLRNVGIDIHPERMRRKLKYSEEGEMQIDLMLSGFDYPFLEWEKREKKPGMRIDIGLCFNAHIDVKVIAAYSKWIAQALYAIELQGIDAEVNLAMVTRGTYRSRPILTRTLIRVKKENEASDFTNWSAMFSPAGFRMLGFTAFNEIGDRNGWEALSSLGSAEGSNSWNVGWDEESRILRISEDQRGSVFPAEIMSDKLRAILRSLS